MHHVTEPLNRDIEKRIELAEHIVGHDFADKDLILSAITHPSAIEDGHVEHTYERLEFLGDSIVGAFTAREIFDRFPYMDEGGMTRIKVSLVSGSSLSKVSDKLGLSDAIIFGGSETGTGKRGLHSALENVYESLVAALYLDAGIDVARGFVRRTLFPLIDVDNAAGPESPKSTLQELLQEDRVTPSYETVDVAGPPHARTFTCNVLANGVVIGTGKGSSKKQAESNAAQDALDKREGRKNEASDGHQGRDGSCT
jgi:ribonuclease-3